MRSSSSGPKDATDARPDEPDFLTLENAVHSSWVEALNPVQQQLAELSVFLTQENRSGRGYLPTKSSVLGAFSRSMTDVKVLVVGQDPYPTPGHGMGLAFSTAADAHPLPKSLINIFKELSDDIGCEAPTSGDLTPWADQGVMLLNRVLTVSPGQPGSHQDKGWEAVTSIAIKALADRDRPLVAILWGKQAQTVIPYLGSTPVVASPHPSPLSAHRGFFGSKPFSQTNQLLVDQGVAPIAWAL